MTSGPWTHAERSGWITVAAILFNCWSLATLAVRARIRTTGHGPWGRDDSALALAQVFALVQGVLAIVAAYWGYGNVVPPSNLEDALKATYASQPLYIASLWACKCSGVLLVARLSPMGPVYRSCKAVAYFTTFWAVASILAVSLRGDLLHPWLTIDGSDIVFRRWLGVEIVGMVIEVALFVLVLFLLWDLQMNDGTMKHVLIASFASRLLVLPICAVRLYYLDPSGYHPQDHGRHAVLAGVLTQAVMHYSLISASIPCLKPFMRPFKHGPPVRIIDNRSDPDRTYSRGGGHLFQYVTAEYAEGKNIALSSLASRGPTWEESLRLNRAREIAESKLRRQKKKNLRGLIEANGDSNFRNEPNQGSAARAGSAADEYEAESLDLAPPDDGDMIIRQTVWTVKRAPAEAPRREPRDPAPR